MQRQLDAFNASSGQPAGAAELAAWLKSLPQQDASGAPFIPTGDVSGVGSGGR